VENASTSIDACVYICIIAVNVILEGGRPEKAKTLQSYHIDADFDSAVNAFAMLISLPISGRCHNHCEFNDKMDFNETVSLSGHVELYVDECVTVSGPDLSVWPKDLRYWIHTFIQVDMS